jgi:hypothetical protein
MVTYTMFFFGFGLKETVMVRRSGLFWNRILSQILLLNIDSSFEEHFRYTTAPIDHRQGAFFY